MKEILLVSDTEIDSQLELAKLELAHYAYSFSFPVPINKACDISPNNTNFFIRFT